MVLESAGTTGMPSGCSVTVPDKVTRLTTVPSVIFNSAVLLPGVVGVNEMKTSPPVSGRVPLPLKVNMAASVPVMLSVRPVPDRLTEVIFTLCRALVVFTSEVKVSEVAAVSMAAILSTLKVIFPLVSVMLLIFLYNFVPERSTSS